MNSDHNHIDELVTMVCPSLFIHYVHVMHIKFTYVFVLDRNFEILILLKPGRDRSVTTAKLSSTNQLERGSDLIRSLYF